MHSFADGSSRLRLLARHPVACAAVALALWLLGTAWLRPLAVPDEGRYASVALAMASSGDWAVPRLDGLPFFHKPPLFYWITAAAIHAFGPTLLAARAASLLGAWLMGMGLLLFVRRHGGARQAVASLLVLATLPFYFGGAQYANLDMLVAGLIGLTVFAAAHALLEAQAGRPFRLWMTLAWVAMVLGVLAKGLIGIVLPGAIVVLWLLWQRHWVGLWRLVSVPGVLLAVLVGLPWFWLMEQRFAGFFHYFFVYQHFQRFAETGFNNALPFWVLPPALCLLTLPWSAFAWRGLRQWRQRRNGAPDQGEDAALSVRPAPLDSHTSLQRLWWVWLVVIVGFFSIPQSKLIGYILPCLPAWAALLAGWALAADSRATQQSDAISPSSPLPTHAGLPRRVTRTALGAAALCLLLIAVASFAPQRSTRASSRAALQAGLQPQDRVLMLGDYWYDAPYYLALTRPVAVALDWNDPDIPRRDNWRKELFDAAAFDPAARHDLLLQPDDVPAWLCAQAPGSPIWIWASADTARTYPWLAAATPIRQPGDKYDPPGIWRITPAELSRWTGTACVPQPRR